MHDIGHEFQVPREIPSQIFIFFALIFYDIAPRYCSY